MKLKKLLSVVLAVMMIVSMMSFGSVMAFAADSYTASADREVYGIADPIVVTVKAPASAAKVYLANESGAGLVSDRVSTPNGDGTNTWTITLNVATMGERTLKVMADGVDTGVTVSFKIVQKYEPDVPDYEEPTFISANGPTSAAVNELFPVTVVTGKGTTQVALFNEYGNGMVSTRLYSENDDGTRSWVLMTSVGSRGIRNFTVKYADDSKRWIDSGETFTVSVGAYQPEEFDPADSKSRSSVHDPSIVKDKDTGEYYIFGSNQGVAKSSDLINWTGVRTSLYGSDIASNLDLSFAGYKDGSTNAGNGTAIWAPCVIYNKDFVNKDGTKGAYMIYYPASSNYKRGVIGFATSQSITGPYTFGANVVYSGFTTCGGPDEPGVTVDTIYTNTHLDELIAAGTLEGFNNDWVLADGTYNVAEYPQCIDPAVFTDKDGKMWMVYGSHAGGIWLLELDAATGMPKYPGKDGTTEAGLQIDRYFGIRIQSGYSLGGEGPYIVYDPVSDYYYLDVTYGQITEGYNQRLFRSKDVTGPYVDITGKNGAVGEDVTNLDEYGVKIMGNYDFSNLSKGYKHGGHDSMIVVDGQLYNIYHQRFETGGNHQNRIHQMFRNEEGWPVMAVYENAGDQISETGYALDEIVGDYEFVDHGTLTSSYMQDTLLVTLNADGTITGDIEGTWSMTKGTYYMNAVINGVTYKGVFYKQQDESGLKRQVMTFSAYGSNNTAIWGSRLSTSDSDFEAVNAAAAKLSVPSSTSVDLPLRSTGDFGTTVFWATSDASVIKACGEITRADENKTATLTAVVMRNGALTIKEFNVRVNKAAEDTEAYSGTPLYNYNFGTNDGFYTKNSGSLVGIGTMVGSASAYNDADKSMVLSVTNENDSKENYLKLPSDTFQGITEGFSIGMWVKTTGSTSIFAFSSEDGNVQLNIPSEGIPSGQWTYYMLTTDKNGYAVYVDGEKVESYSSDISYIFESLSNLDIRVGAGKGTVYVDDLTIYGTALTASEAKSLVDPNSAWQTSWKIDFGTETSPVQGGFTQMTEKTVYNKKLELLQAYGFDREINSYKTAAGGAKICDFVYAEGGAEYKFMVDLPNGTYRVFMYTGAKDSINTTHFYFQDNKDDIHTQVTPEGVASDNYGGPNTYNVEVTDGKLTITIWGDAEEAAAYAQAYGGSAMSGRIGSIEITKIG